MRSRLTFSDAGIVAVSSTKPVIEEGHPDLERVRHRGAVEVVKHVVHQFELRVEKECGLRWFVGNSIETGPGCALG